MKKIHLVNLFGRETFQNIFENERRFWYDNVKEKIKWL